MNFSLQILGMTTQYITLCLYETIVYEQNNQYADVILT
jgi:hypothetical protein